jgi:hypothetical protein
MKRALYNVSNEEFLALLERTDQAFRGKGLEHMFVGGVATQFHIANYLCSIYGLPFRELVESDRIRIQDHLRSTDDVDIALRMDGGDIDSAKRVSSVLNTIKGEFFSPSEEDIIAVKSYREGHVRPQFRLEVNDNSDPDKVVSFNLYRRAEDLRDGNLKEFEKKYYDEFMDRASDVTLPYFSGKNITLKLKSPEDLLATKIARGRDKDIGDALSLSRHSRAANAPISDEKVRNILCGPDEKYGVPNPVLFARYDTFKKMEELLA